MSCSFLPVLGIRKARRFPIVLSARFLTFYIPLTEPYKQFFVWHFTSQELPVSLYSNSLPQRGQSTFSSGWSIFLMRAPCSLVVYLVAMIY